VVVVVDDDDVHIDRAKGFTRQYKIFSHRVSRLLGVEAI
jgi:hypothetical protein